MLVVEVVVEVDVEREGGGWVGWWACSHGNCAVSTSVRVMRCPLSLASHGLSQPQLDMTACVHMQKMHTHTHTLSDKKNMH